MIFQLGAGRKMRNQSPLTNYKFWLTTLVQTDERPLTARIHPTPFPDPGLVAPADVPVRLDLRFSWGDIAITHPGIHSPKGKNFVQMQ